MMTPLSLVSRILNWHVDAYTTATAEGPITIRHLCLYLSEAQPQKATARVAAMYGGADNPCAAAAV